MQAHDYLCNTSLLCHKYVSTDLDLFVVSQVKHNAIEFIFQLQPVNCYVSN